MYDLKRMVKDIHFSYMLLVLLKLRREISSVDIKNNNCFVLPNGLTVPLSQPHQRVCRRHDTPPPFPGDDLLLLPRMARVFYHLRFRGLITLAFLKTNSSIFQISLTCIGTG